MTREKTGNPDNGKQTPSTIYKKQQNTHQRKIKKIPFGGKKNTV